MDSKKVKAIVEWLQPVDAKEFNVLWGPNFHKKFSPEFAKLAAPIDECRNMTKIEWTPKRVQFFEHIKGLFAKGILLRYSN